MNNPEDRIENHALLKNLVQEIEYVLASEIETFIAGNLGRGPDKSHCRRCKIIRDELLDDVSAALEMNTKKSPLLLNLKNTVISRDYVTFLNQTARFNPQQLASFLEEKLNDFIQSEHFDFKISPILFHVFVKTRRGITKDVLQPTFVSQS
ncbi:MAG: hypothetical protein PHU71_03180 [Candidatus Gracilibacteria bacterium]|nr:hypothetical protein [Candidatus Gracilibacteria bacterium]